MDGCGHSGGRAARRRRGAGGSPASLNATLEPYLASYGMPALAAAVAKDGAVVAAGAVGTRRSNEEPGDARRPLSTSDPTPRR
ncbi:MAG: hypothetical protein U0802_21155 [Candidatus Binatia bacterium]